jgi:hypothetical protein
VEISKHPNVVKVDKTDGSTLLVVLEGCHVEKGEIDMHEKEDREGNAEAPTHNKNSAYLRELDLVRHTS